jgi:ribosomal protein S18 acetylase RimI-like enzyme
MLDRPKGAPTNMQYESDLSIEIATPADAAAMAHIQKEGWLTTYPNVEYGITTSDILTKDFDSSARIQQRLKWLHEEGETTFSWVARLNSRVVGYCSVEKKEAANKIAALYVLPGFQGRGIGSRLLWQALGWLGGHKNITLGVVSYNQRAINFYQKFGFEMGEPVRHEVPVMRNGKDLPELEMILRLPKLDE